MYRHSSFLGFILTQLFTEQEGLDKYTSTPKIIIIQENIIKREEGREGERVIHTHVK